MKDKKILYGIMIAFVFLLSIGLTYAYFSVTTAVIGDRNDIKASVGTLNILYTDGPEIVAENIEPGWTTEKTVKVKNTGTLKAYYSLIWSSLTNEIENDELVLEGTCNSDTDTCEDIPTQVVSGDEIVIGVGISPGEEHTYVITFTFIETGSAQNYNQEKAFNGVLNVIESNEAFTLMGRLLDSNEDPLSGATIEIHSTLRRGITDSNGNFEIKGVEVGDHEITIKNSSSITIATDTLVLLSDETESIIGNQITGNTNEGTIGIKVKLGTSSINTISLLEWYEKCTAVSTDIGCKILTNNTVYKDNVSSPYVTASTGVDFTAKSTLTNGQGLYTNNKLEDGKNTYFRGGSFCAYPSYASEDSFGTYCTAAGGSWDDTYHACNLNSNRTTCQTKGYMYYDLKNNVTFAGHSWRIIRIDENGNVRLMLGDDSVSTTTFNTSTTDNAYVGYMYGSLEETISTTTSTLSIGTSSTYYYSTSYERNASNQYYLTGTMVSGKWNTASICTSSVCPVASYYTCKSTSSSGTCDTLYKISSWNSTTYANVYTITNESQSYELAHQNITSSTIKIHADNWYTSNLSSYSSYIADAGYCNDRSLSTGLGYGTNTTYYGPYARNYPNNTASPRLSCSNVARDLFTTSTSLIGNKALTYPIGLMTIDETRYAGITNNSNFTNYLKFNDYYQVISPYDFSSLYAHGNGVSKDGYLVGSFLNVLYDFRPSISLKRNFAVSSGTGAYDDPYVIQ